MNIYLLPAAAAAKSLQSCPTLCDPIDGSPKGSSLPGILQARILEWVAISFSNAWSKKCKWSRSVVSDLLPRQLQKDQDGYVPKYYSAFSENFLIILSSKMNTYK